MLAKQHWEDFLLQLETSLQAISLASTRGSQKFANVSSPSYPHAREKTESIDCIWRGNEISEEWDLPQVPSGAGKANPTLAPTCAYSLSASFSSGDWGHSFFPLGYSSFLSLAHLHVGTLPFTIFFLLSLSFSV